MLLLGHSGGGLSTQIAPAAQIIALTALSPDPYSPSADESVTYFYGGAINIAADVTGVVLQNGAILDGATNRVTVKDGVAVSLYNVTFEGDARTIILVDNDADPAAAVSIVVNGLSATAGSTITADDATNVTFTLDGIPRPLPFTHWAGTRAAFLAGLMTDQVVSATDVIYGYLSPGISGTLQVSVDGANWHNLTAGSTTYGDITEFSEDGLAFDLFAGVDGVAWDAIKLRASGAVTVTDPWDLFAGGDVGALLMPGYGSRCYQSTNGAANSTAHMLPAGPGDPVGFMVDQRHETGPARTTYREQGELLINSDFDAGTVAWTSEAPDTFEVVSGALHIVEAGATPLGCTQETGVDPYSLVRVQARFRKDGATGRCDFTIWDGVNEITGTELFDRNFNPDNGGSWNFIDNVFVAGDTGVLHLTVRAVDGCDIEFDMISIKAVPPVTDVGTEVVPDPFFSEWADSTYPDGWTKGGTHDASNYFQLYAGGDAGLEAISDGTQTPYIELAASATNDVLYRIDYVVAVADAGALDLSVGGTSTLLTLDTAERGHAFVTADATGAWRLRINGTTDLTVQELQIRPVPALANTTAQVTNGDFDDWADSTVPDDWSKVGTHDGSNYVEEASGGAGLRLVSDSQLGVEYAAALTAGNWYEIEVDVRSVASGGAAIKDGAANVFSEIGSAGRWRKFYQAANTGALRVLGGATSTDLIIDEIVVNEIPGVCWEQSTDADRPTMRDDEYGLLGDGVTSISMETSQDMTGVNAMMLAINLYGFQSDTIAICDGDDMRIQRDAGNDEWKQANSADLFAMHTGEFRVNGLETNVFPRGEPHTIYGEKATSAAGDFDAGARIMAHDSGGYLNGVFIFGFLRDSHLSAQERADLEQYMAYMMGV